MYGDGVIDIDATGDGEGEDGVIDVAAEPVPPALPEGVVSRLRVHSAWEQIHDPEPTADDRLEFYRKRALEIEQELAAEESEETHVEDDA